MNRGSKKRRQRDAWWVKIVILSVVLLTSWIPAEENVRAAANPPIVVTPSSFDIVDNNPGDGICTSNFNNMCSLRAALMEANARPGMDTIILPAGTFLISLAGTGENDAKSGDLDILDDVTIIGANGDSEGDPAKTVIDGAGVDRVFSMNPYWNKPVSVTFQALTITNGRNTDNSGGDGGALDWEASGSGSLLIYNCVISNNQTDKGNGGGVALFNSNPLSGAKARIEKSIIRNNSTVRNGGGIFVGMNVPVEIVSSTIADNSVQGVSISAYGGGLYFNGAASSFVKNSTISYNKALGFLDGGGGVYAVTPIVITDSTVSGNLANGSGGGFRSTQAAQLVNVTVTNNQAGTSGGGISTSSNAVEVHNSLIAGNTGPTLGDLEGTLLGTSSYNLIGTGGAGGLSNNVNGNLVGVSNPGIGPLADNGGPAQTHALLPGSPALDNGSNAKAASSTDQRGLARIEDAADGDLIQTVDIGAFEAQVSVEDIGNQTMLSNSSLSVPFTIGEAVSIAGSSSIVASSTNTALVPNASANLEVLPGGSASTRILKITPASGQVGTTNISVSISGGSLGSMTDTFALTVNPAPVPDLTVALNTGSLYRGKTGATSDISVRNNGAAPTSGAVTLTATLPAELTATDMSGNGWVCDKSTFTCTRSDALAAGSTYPTVTITFDVAANAPATVTTSASVTGTGETNSANNTASTITVVSNPPDLLITKSHTGNFVKGQKGAVYHLTVTNIGEAPTALQKPVVVVDSLPMGLIPKSMVGTGWDCSDFANLTCTRSDVLNPGASYPAIIVTVDVADHATANLTNTATVSGGGELNTANNSASDPTVIDKLVDLHITKTHTGSFRQGQTGATYTVVVKNNGIGSTNQQVTVTEQIPTAMTLTDLQGDGWTCNKATATCFRDDALAAGESYPPITVTVDVAGNAPASLTNTVTVSGGGDLDPGDNIATDPTAIVQLADLTIAKSHTGDFAQGQKGATYKLTVTNQGSGPSVGQVTVTDSLPTGLTLTAMQGEGWTCDTATAACKRNDPLAAGESYASITVTVDVAENAPASLTNTATVSGGDDRDAGNNTATDLTAITLVADLTIAKSHTGDFAQGQKGGTYTLTVTNEGSGATVGTVSVTDVLPDGLTLTGLSGTGWTCSMATATCSRSDSLAQGASFDPITATVDVATNASATLTNTAIVSGGGELNTTNNHASDPTNIVQLPDLVITLSHSGTFEQGQTGATYLLDVSNRGTGSTVGKVTAAFVPPAGLTLTRLDGVAWNCNPATGVCERSDSLPAGASYDPILATVDVAADAPLRVVATATVSGTDVNPANNTVTDITTITLPPSTNASLSGLNLSGAKLEQPFSADQTVYTAKAAYSAKQTTVTPQPADSKATVTVNGQVVKNGNSSSPIALNVGSNEVTIVVTAEDAVTTRTYSITIERASGPVIPPYVPPVSYPVSEVELDRTSLDLIAGGQAVKLSHTIQPSNATDQRVTWSSSDETVAQVDGNGMVTPLAPGTATITVTTLDQGRTATCLVTVKEQPISRLEVNLQGIWLKPIRTKSLRVFAVQEDGERIEVTKDKETRYTIEARDGSQKVATISKTGVVRGKTEGEAVITVRYKEKTATIPVTISKASVSAIAATHNELSIEAGYAVQLEITATLSNKKTMEVTFFAEYEVTDKKVATVQNGKVSALAPGTTTVTARFEGKEVTIPVEVTEAKQVKRLVVSKRKATVKQGEDLTIQVTAYYQDGTRKKVTEQAEWVSEDETIATVESGTIVAKAKGTTTIITKYRGKSIRIVVNVTE